ncbi:MAG TPA: TMEM175 family protein [Thermoanaerobaculia bacterium]|nr:TMEM175 family protein [Thermoanaerobaculia bacterium]
MADSTRFRHRGREVSRVEAFSDVVFGFALTLIVVSLEVPQTYKELMQIMRGFPAFAICFAILTWVWHCHHTFFRRYALTNEYTIFLNTVLLFLVLFYTYPLKFIFSIVTGQVANPYGNARNLFVIYGLGYAGIFAVLLLMYQHAWSKREELELNDYELYDTRTAMIMYSSYIAIGLLSTAIAIFANRSWIAWAGLIYFLIGPVSALIGFKRGTKREAMATAALSPE